MTDAAIPMGLRASACSNVPAVPASDLEWQKIHKQHVHRLASAWESLISSANLDAVVVYSGVEARKYSRDDQFWPAALTPHFLHWIPYEETPALLVIRPASNPKLYCRSPTSFWDSPGAPCELWDRAFFDIEMVGDLASVKLSGRVAFIGDDLSIAHALGIPSEECNRDDVLSKANLFRTLKSDYEVVNLVKANTIAAVGHAQLKSMFESGAYSELELHHAYLSVTSQTDFTVPYGNIVAMGANCGVLHHVHYERRKIHGDTSLLVDAGARHLGYASDITRTWVRGQGEAASAFRGLVRAVDAVQRELVKSVTVGKPYEDLHNQAHELLAGVLISAGIVKCSAEAAVSGGVTRLFFPHGLGHSLGIQVHDVGMRLRKPSSDNPYLRNTSVLAAGHVVTIEPGIYFIPKLMQELMSGSMSNMVNTSLVKALMPFGGIRIEDDILATELGPVNLSAGCSHE